MNEAELERILEAAHRQTLASFRDQVARGERNPVAERAEYRRRRRDYATCLRMDTVPEEARALAGRLLETHGLSLPPEARGEFERAVLKMLLRLYDAFLDETGQGSR